MKRLPHDFEHCFNFECERKDTCIRFTQRNEGHQMTPCSNNSCVNGDAFLLDENIEDAE